MIKSRIVNCNKSGGNHLDLGNLKLSKYPSELKKPLNKLQQLVVKNLDCSQNQLNDFKWDLSTDFHSLESLDLSGNPVSSLLMIGLPGSIWLKTLVKLNLSNCKLTKFGQSDLKHLPSLRFLSLANNDIADLLDEQLTLPEIEHLDLKNNPINRLPLVGCINLMVLDITGCKISQLPTQLGEMDRMIELRAGGNQIEILPDSIGKLTRLSVLELQDNRIKSVPLSIGYCRGLTLLRMEGNPVEDYTTLGAITMGSEKLIAFLEKRLIDRCQEVASTCLEQSDDTIINNNNNNNNNGPITIVDEASVVRDRSRSVSPVVAPISIQSLSVNNNNNSATTTPVSGVSPRNNNNVTNIQTPSNLLLQVTPTAPLPISSPPRNIIQISPRHVNNNSNANVNISINQQNQYNHNPTPVMSITALSPRNIIQVGAPSPRPSSTILSTSPTKSTTPTQQTSPVTPPLNTSNQTNTTTSPAPLVAPVAPVAPSVAPTPANNSSTPTEMDGVPQQIKYIHINQPQRMILSNSPPMQMQQHARQPTIYTPPISLSSSPTIMNLNKSPLSELDRLRDRVYTLIRYDLKHNIATIYDRVVKSPNIDNLVVYAKVIKSSQDEIEQLSNLLSYRNFQFTLNTNSKAIYNSSPQTVEDKFKYLKKLLKSKIEEVLVYSRSVVDHLEQCNLNDVMNILKTIETLNTKLNVN